MKKHMYLLIAMMFMLFLTACDSGSTSDSSNITEAEHTPTSAVVTDWWEEDEEGDGANAIFYDGERYYGLVMYSTEIPNDLELLGTTPTSSMSDIYGRYFTGEAVPTEELQTNWTNARENIYAEYDESGEIIAFWTEPGVTGEAAYLGSISKVTPPYYDLPDDEAPVT